MPAAFTFTLKSSRKWLVFWKGILEPLILVWTDLRISNDKRVLSHVITTAYGSPSFLENLVSQMFQEHLAFDLHSAICAENQSCKGPHFHIQYSLLIFPLLLILVLLEYRRRGCVLVTLGVNMRYSDVEKCCYSSWPEPSCLYIQSCLRTCDGGSQVKSLVV